MSDEIRYVGGIDAGTGKIVTVENIPVGSALSIVDGGLEIWTDGNNLTNWGFWQPGTGGMLDQETVNVKVGTFSAKITKGTETVVLYQRIGTAYNGRTVTVGCWCKSANTVAHQIELGVHDLAWTTNISDFYQNSGNWEYLTATFFVPPSNENLTIELRIGSIADAPVYFDAVSGVVGEGVWDGANELIVDVASVNLNAFARFQVLLRKSVNAGQFTSKTIVSTYSLIYTTSTKGGVLSPNGDIHFVPYNAPVGQKINPSGVVSTYSLVYTRDGAYAGGILSPNGDIHFIPDSASVGQKINPSGVVSTYSLIYTTSNAYTGGVLSPNGDIHFVPYIANRGQKVSPSGIVSTYSLIYTASAAYAGGVLSPNGDIHFIPMNAEVGQKISITGVVSTYSLVYTASAAYYGGVLSPNGDIHFIPLSAAVGQKISPSGIVSTYSLVYTRSYAYAGGVLSPNGDIHFIPFNATIGQKKNYLTGAVTTYSLIHTSSTAQLFRGGILAPNGDIHFIPYHASIGQKISTLPVIPFSRAVCCSPFFNKF